MKKIRNLSKKNTFKFVKNNATLFIVGLFLLIALPITLSTIRERQVIKQHAAVTTHQVTIQNYTMNPATLTINAGDTVTWTNQDSDDHDSVADSGLWSSPTLGQGESFSFTFTQPGTFTYFCSPHKSIMKGYKIIVLAAPTNIPTVPPAAPSPTSTLPTVIPPTVPMAVSPTNFTLGPCSDPAACITPTDIPPTVDPNVGGGNNPGGNNPGNGNNGGGNGNNNNIIQQLINLLQQIIQMLQQLFGGGGGGAAGGGNNPGGNNNNNGGPGNNNGNAGGGGEDD